MIRLGLCCLFFAEPIKFRTTTAASMRNLTRAEQLTKLSRIIMENAEALRRALGYCAKNRIGCFRVNSQILPLKTHPDVGYSINELPNASHHLDHFRECGKSASQSNLRITFHPDQFVVLNSPTETVVTNSLQEIEYQNEVAEWIGADVINVHAGGVYGDKVSALNRLRRNLPRLSPSARSRLTVENDDKNYTPADLLPLCSEEGIPLVYDVHHHRCNPDHLTIAEASRLALATWDREPLFHLSSPKEGWNGAAPHRHHDFIDFSDFPDCWLEMETDITIEVEAKKKELAIFRLRNDLAAKK